MKSYRKVEVQFLEFSTSELQNAKAIRFMLHQPKVSRSRDLGEKSLATSGSRTQLPRLPIT
jgi:hypothetical protein